MFDVGGGATKILIVDDCEDTAQTFAMILARRGGHSTRFATNAEEAIRLALTEPPDVLLLDPGLRGKTDGLSICRQLRREPWGASTVIIAISGWTAKEQQDAAFAAGCDFFLTKPVAMPDLERAIRKGRRKPAQRADHEPEVGVSERKADGA